MDVLTDMLQGSRARGAAFAHTRAHGDWGVAFPASPGLAIHCVADGEVLVRIDGGAAARLLPGDLALVRGAREHALVSGPHARAVPLAALAPVDPGGRRLTVGRPDASVTAAFFCGAYLFEGDLCDGLIGALPDVVALRPAAGSALRATMDLLAGEILHDEPGQQTLLDRLLDIALVQVVREHFAAAGAAAPPWYRASLDPRIGAALRALHAAPARAWTVEALAREALLSRAAFARRFTALLGVAPLEYLTNWRMALARERLRSGEDGLAAIARDVGYASEFSFAAAFKRRHGTPPGRWRAAAR